MLQGERSILAPSFRGTVSHDAEGVAEHWQEREEAAHVFWWIRRQRKDASSGAIFIKALLQCAVCQARLSQRCDNLPRQRPTQTILMCSHLIQIHPVLKTLQKSMSYTRKVVLILPSPNETFNSPLCFIPLHILR